MLASGQIVFGGILTALVNHLQTSSLKWNNIPFSLLSIRLPDLPLFLSPALLLIVSPFSQSYSIWVVVVFPSRLSVCPPRRAFCQWRGASHSLTDRETVTASLSQSPVAHSGPSSLADEVIIDLMSLLTPSPTYLLLLLQGAPVVLP